MQGRNPQTQGRDDSMKWPKRWFRGKKRIEMNGTAMSARQMIQPVQGLRKEYGIRRSIHMAILKGKTI